MERLHARYGDAFTLRIVNSGTEAGVSADRRPLLLWTSSTWLRTPAWPPQRARCDSEPTLGQDTRQGIG